MRLHWRTPRQDELGDIGGITAGIVWPTPGAEHDTAYENYLRGLVRQYVTETASWRTIAYLLALITLGVLVLDVFILMALYHQWCG